MSQANDIALQNAVDRGAPAVVSLPSDAMLRNYKSRFLGSDDRGIWVEGEPHERALIESLIAHESLIGVSSKLRFEKLQFVSQLLDFRPDFQVSANCTVLGLLVKTPAEVVLTQRRNDYRVRTRPENEIAVQIWQIPEHVYVTDRPSARLLLEAEVRDVSVGGLGVVVYPKSAVPPRLTPDERLRVVLTYPGEELLLEARLAFTATDGLNITQCGLAFQNLERDLEGRQKLAKLNKLVGTLQREEVRRARIAAA